MELFPSMTFNDVMDMPYKQFRAIHQIRIKRKINEQKNLDRERKKMEEKNEKEMIRNRILKGKAR